MLAARYTLGAYQLHAAYAANRGMGTVGGSILGTAGTGAAVLATTGTVTGGGAAIAGGPVGAPGAASRDLLLGLCATFGPHSFAGSVVQHADRSPADKDARQYGVAYLYALSKRTDLYTAYARIRNTNGATFTVGNASDDGKGRSAINIGLRHLL
jgi:predicted porin